jgi:putative transposase
MARSRRITFAGAKYHVTVRGNAGQEVFQSDEYYGRFIEQLIEALEKDEVVLYSFVLMPNHYHVFVQTPHGNIQRFMQRLNTSYNMYHRYKHQSPGHCFQGRYGAKLVEGDQYILALTRYIHLNPVKVAEFGKANREQKLAELLAADRGLQQQMAALTKTLGED